MLRPCEPVPGPSRPPFLPRTGTIRSGAMNAKSGRGPPQVLLFSFRSRIANVYWRGVRLDGGNPCAGRPGAELALPARARPSYRNEAVRYAPSKIWSGNDRPTPLTMFSRPAMNFGAVTLSFSEIRP